MGFDRTLWESRIGRGYFADRLWHTNMAVTARPIGTAEPCIGQPHESAQYDDTEAQPECVDRQVTKHED